MMTICATCCVSPRDHASWERASRSDAREKRLMPVDPARKSACEQGRGAAEGVRTFSDLVNSVGEHSR